MVGVRHVECCERNESDDKVGNLLLFLRRIAVAPQSPILFLNSNSL